MELGNAGEILRRHKSFARKTGEMTQEETNTDTRRSYKFSRLISVLGTKMSTCECDAKHP